MTLNTRENILACIDDYYSKRLSLKKLIDCLEDNLQACSFEQNTSYAIDQEITEIDALYSLVLSDELIENSEEFVEYISKSTTKIKSLL